MIIKSNGSGEGDRFVSSFLEISRNYEKSEQEWIISLKKDGIKAAHPDDGWVDRTKNIVQFVYPQFNSGVNIGDYIVLGSPDKYRVVKVINIEIRKFLTVSTLYTFEDV